MKPMKHLLTFIFVTLLAMTAVAQTVEADAILGTFQATSPFNDDTAHIKVTRLSNGTYQGRVVWVNHNTNPDGTPRRDKNNKDPKLRSRLATEVILFWDLRYDDGEWVKGKLYDDVTGKTFSIKISIDKNGKDLKARYYKGVPAVGITKTWKRIK